MSRELRNLRGILDSEGMNAIVPAERPWIERPVPATTPTEDLVTVVSVKEALGISEPPPQVVQPLRRFFQPLPKGSCAEWPKELDGLSPQNIAMILAQPQILYTDYEKNKNNPPVKIFVPAPTSYDRPKDVERVAVKAVGVNDILVEDTGFMVPTEHDFEWKRRKQLPSDELLGRLDRAKEKRDDLNAQFNLAKKTKAPNRNEIEALRKRANREIKELELDAKGTWGWVKVEKDCHKIFVPPRPEGCVRRFYMPEVKRYITEAFGSEGTSASRAMRRRWQYCWTEFENHVIKLAWHEGIITPWPNPNAKARFEAGQLLQEILSPVLDPIQMEQSARERFESLYPVEVETEIQRQRRKKKDWTVYDSRRVNRALTAEWDRMDEDAREAALTGYNVLESGERADEAIRRNHRGAATEPELQGMGYGRDDFDED